MKKAILGLLFVLMLITSFPLTAFAYGDYDHVYIEVTEVPYKPVYAFLHLNLEAGSAYTGGNIGLISARPSDLQFQTLVGFRSVSSKEANIGVFDIMLGGTYFPRKPSFAVGDMPVRLKVSALGGMGLSNDMFFTLLFSVGLVFSSGDDPNGMTMDLVLRSGVAQGETNIPGTVGFQVGFLFAPVAGGG